MNLFIFLIFKIITFSRKDCLLFKLSFLYTPNMAYYVSPSTNRSISYYGHLRIHIYNYCRSKRGDTQDDGMAVTMTMQEDNISITRQNDGV